MAISWADVRAKVRGDLWRPGVTGLPDDQCDRAIHSSLRELETRRRWLWLERVLRTVVLTAPADQVAIPDELVSLASATLVRADGTMDEPLQLATISRVRIVRSQTAAAGYPAMYAIGDRVIYLDAEAAAGQRIEFVGKFRTPDSIEAAITSAEANPSIQLHAAAVVSGACAHACRTYLKSDDNAARQQAEFDRLIEILEDREDEQRSDTFGGGVVPDTYYHDMAGGR